jgi:DNA-binding response OmpR family regulator
MTTNTLVSTPANTLKVLLIEDNPGDARLIRESLTESREVRGSSFNLEYADRLSVGLARLAEGGIDAILLDLSLPDSHGLDTLSKMYVQAPGVPILVLTGLDDETIGLEAVQNGAQDYLVKGQIDGQLLARSIRYAIERKQSEEHIERQMKRLAALRSIDAAITSSLDLSLTLNILLEQVTSQLHVDAAGVLILNTHTGSLEHVAARGFSTNGRSRSGKRLGEGYAGRAALEQRTINIPDITAA